MDLGSIDAGTIAKPKTISRVMVLIGSGVVAFEAYSLMSHISPTSFEGIGTLSAGTISLILLQIVALSCVVGIFSLVILLDKEGWFDNRLRFVSTVLFAAGLLLSVEGLVTIYFNGFIQSGTTSIMVVCIGLELYTLGMLSMVSYMQNGKNSPLERPFPLTAAILFMILLLPPAFVIN